MFHKLQLLEQALTLLFRNLGFAEHQTFGPNLDEDRAKVLLLTSCYQEVAWSAAYVCGRYIRS